MSMPSWASGPTLVWIIPILTAERSCARVVPTATTTAHAASMARPTRGGRLMAALYNSRDRHMQVVILVGLPGSGKSTFYAERFAATHVHVSRDNFPNNRNPGRRQATLL